MSETATVDLEAIDRALSRFAEFDGNLIMMLHEIQTICNYLPEEALELLSRKTGFSLQRIYSIATFYNHFSLVPRGRHVVHVCMGTACHVQGAGRVLGELEQQLGVKEGGTTEDMAFSLGAVRCVGACSLAPVVLIDGQTHSGVLPRKVKFLLRKVRKKDGTHEPE
jgi:NADH:ubiquinone oxidoreductase subunit E